MTTKKSPVFIAFASQKGGVGKTSVAELVSSILHYKRGYKILVLDCDYPQLSFFYLREREETYLKKNDEVKNKVESFYKRNNTSKYNLFFYDNSMQETFSFLDDFLNETNEDIDIVIVDTKGAIMDKDLSIMMPRLDYIFSPIELDRQSIESSMAYCLSVLDYQRIQEQKGFPLKLKGIYLFWNKYNKPTTEKQSNVLSQLTSKMEQMGVPVMEEVVNDTILIKREMENCRGDLSEVVRTTLLPPAYDKIRKTTLNDFVTELLGLCGFEPNKGKDIEDE